MFLSIFFKLFNVLNGLSVQQALGCPGICSVIYLCLVSWVLGLIVKGDLDEFSFRSSFLKSTGLDELLLNGKLVFFFKQSVDI